ncbi:MAG: hypothetical protein D6766_08360 [Verrucomicrobia bacterium]|nr:MAG: hypothetical protein D6766_08360 [Verrucomicrobiota bacterium]
MLVAAAVLAGLAAVGGELLPADSTAAEAPSSARETGATPSFRDFLTRPPWIRRVVFRRSGNVHPVTIRYEQNTERTHIPAWVEFEGSLQPKGYYLKFLPMGHYIVDIPKDGPVVHRPPPAGWEYVMGATAEYWWWVGDQVWSLAPRAPRPGHSPRNGPEILARMHMGYLEELRWLGVPELADAGSIHWSGPDRFEAVSRSHGMIQGVILQWSGSTPVALECRVAGPPARVRRVEYGHDASPTLPPREMRVTLQQDGRTVTHTNLIEVWESGLDPRHSEGFKPSEFRPPDVTFERTYFYSNGVRHAVSPEGRLEPVEGFEPDFSELEVRSGSKALTVVLLTAIAFGGVGMLWWLRTSAAGRKQGNRPLKTETSEQDRRNP